MPILPIVDYSANSFQIGMPIATRARILFEKEKCKKMKKGFDGIKAACESSHVMNTQAQIKTTIRKTDGEYRVRLYVDGEHQAGADYFTDDMGDAKATALAMEENARNGARSDKSSQIAVEEAADDYSTLYCVCNDMTLEEGEPELFGSKGVIRSDGVYYYDLHGDLFALKSHEGRDGEEI